MKWKEGPLPENQVVDGKKRKKMKQKKSLLAACLCAVTLLMSGCAGQVQVPSGSEPFPEDTASSQTASVLESETKAQPVEQSQEAEAASPGPETQPVQAAAPQTQSVPDPQPVACQHSFHDVGYDSTCSTPGRHVYVCTKCGYTEYGEEIPLAHNGKYVCEYCGLPLKEEGCPVHCLYDWVQRNGTPTPNGLGYAVEALDGDRQYSMFADSYDIQWPLTVESNRPDGSMDGPNLRMVLHDYETTVDFHFYNQYASGHVSVERASVSRNNLPQLDNFYVNSGAPEEGTTQQLQQEFEQELIRLLDGVQTKLLPQMDYTLADLGFTAW